MGVELINCKIIVKDDKYLKEKKNSFYLKEKDINGINLRQ